MCPLSRPITLCAVLVGAALPAGLSARADPRLEGLKAEALQMVEARSEMVQDQD